MDRMSIQQQSMIFDFDDVIDIKPVQLSKVFSFNFSQLKKFCLLGTNQGFSLIHNATKTFQRYENQKNPFKLSQDTGVQLGSPLQQRPQAAVVPSKSSSKYSKTSVYIYNYQLNTILYSNDYFLPIRDLTLTDETIIVSNNKRIIIYNYINDTEKKDQQYYLRMYKSQQPNTNVRYLEMNCEQKILNNTIRQIDQYGKDLKTYKQCLCGKYALSGIKPYRMFYSKVNTFNGMKMIQLSIYDWVYDKQNAFQTIIAPYMEPFFFTISDDGKYIAYSENYGRNVVIQKVEQKGKICTITISSSIKSCLDHGFFIVEDTLWYTVIRRGEGSGTAGRMHFFKVQKKNQNEIVKSNYSRYFNLFEKTILQEGVSDRLIGPNFYVVDGFVFVSSICGYVTEIINLQMSGNHIKKKAENESIWKEEKN